MVCLMALSNAHGWLMLNTGNKSEAAMGYSTLYGDTAGAFAPLGGVYKTDVFAMARWRNRRAVEEGTCGPIPVNVFVKPPSAELAPDQEDEKSLGVDYATLDRILIAYVEEGRDAAAIVAESGLSRDWWTTSSPVPTPTPSSAHWSLRTLTRRSTALPCPVSEAASCWRSRVLLANEPRLVPALFNRLVSYTPRCMARGGAVVYHSGHG